ncbi:MAG: amidophosphoribosyltransferase, partial [Planctomycetota bacterium]
CAFDLINAKWIATVEPGEMVIFSKRGIKKIRFSERQRSAMCVFEFIYFARPDSVIFGKSVNDVRIELGKQLAREHPVDADLVVDVPDSGTPAALGYSEQSKIPYNRGFVRSHFTGRTFITPFQTSRELHLRLKLNPIKSVIKNKKIVVVDDSIVRGNTAKLRVSQLRNAGAKEVHYRIASPPIKFPCFFGIDFPTKEELIAANLSIEEIAKEINVDSLNYLSIEGMLKVIGLEKDYCTACFSGKYKVLPPRSFNKNIFEEKY